MKAEAEANADSDKEAKERVDKMNGADQLIFQTEKQLSEYGDKIPEEKKAAIEAGAAKLKEAHKAEDIAGIDAAMEELNAAWQNASQEMYAATQEAGAEGGATADAGAAGGSDNKEEEVTDVEFEEVEDK